MGARCNQIASGRRFALTWIDAKWHKSDIDMDKSRAQTHLRLIVTPNFNMAATMGFIDPFRAANYLDGIAHFRWDIVSDRGGVVSASNGTMLETLPLAEAEPAPDFLIVSCSWTPEDHATAPVLAALRRAASRNITLGGIDTGAFILARAGLDRKLRPTVQRVRTRFPGELRCARAAAA